MPDNRRVRVNVRSVMNTAAVRRERRNGRDLVIVPSATLPDNIVMNKVLYTADEIAKSYRTLERSPAPLGHPTINGKFVSAADPEGINIGYIGAWNENVVRQNGRVFMDKVIDVDIANRMEGGSDVLDAIEKGDPIHTSTGLLANLEEASSEDAHSFTARDIYFDHDAILLGESGAATPDQGVGMLVNGEQVEVINSIIDDAVNQIEWAADIAARASEQLERAPVVERLKTAILEAVGLTERETSAKRKDADMADEKQHSELSAKVEKLQNDMTTVTETLGGLGDVIKETVANAVKPLTDNLEAIQNAQKAKDEAEKTELVNKVVKAGLLEEAEAKELTNSALKSLAKRAEPGNAAGLSGNFGGVHNNTDDEFKDVDLNAGMEAK